MAILSDFHLHSFFSADSDTPMEDQVRAAIKAGLSSICFTEHFDPDWPYANTPKEDLGAPFSVDMKAYLAELSRMRELYGDQIRIFSGIEVGLAEGFEEETLSFVNDHRELDFLIGSVHSCHHGDPYYPDFFAGASVAERVWSLGHLDYVLRYAIQQEDPELLSFLNRKGQSYGSYCFAANRDVIEEILRILIARGTALEVNTQAIAKAAGADSSDLSIYRETNPGRDTILLYRELGGRKITIGADAHVPEGVGKGFDKAEALLRSCGFNSYTTFEKKAPVVHPL